MTKKRTWKQRVGWAFLILLGSLLLVAVWALWIASGEEMHYTNFQPNKAHHGKNKFVNTHTKQDAPSPWKALPGLYKIPLNLAGQGKHPAPSVSPEYRAKRLSRQRDSVTWIGHAAFQIRLKEANILADPVLGERASPFSFVGPKRFQPPGLNRKEIGTVDIIFLSHNHYDHYDRGFLASLPRRESIDMVVPLGFRKALEKLGYRKIHELDWWESKRIRGLKFVCYPVQHFSGRGLGDRAKSLWASWGIFAKGLRLYFAGDTGYFPGFKKIGIKGGPFDLAFVPIGAYEPRELFRPIHMNPEEAVQASKELRAQRMVGMHWGTFPLSLEPPKEPPRRFRAAAKKAGYSKANAWIMKVGETRLLKRRVSSPTSRPTSQPSLLNTKMP